MSVPACAGGDGDKYAAGSVPWTVCDSDKDCTVDSGVVLTYTAGGCITCCCISALKRGMYGAANSKQGRG